MTSDGWFDIEAGPVVRPYAMTAGRTTGAFDLIAIVIAVRGPMPGDEAVLGPEALEILRYAQRPVSVAEVSAHLDLPAGTVRVLLADLLGMGLIHTRAPEAIDHGPLLEAVINGLRAL
jgi:Protein of unknown function (DUF742)